jgi:glutathione S-transferase
MLEARETFYRVWFQTKYEKQKETEQTKYKTDTLPEILKGIEKLMKTYGNGTWAVGNNVTWADLFIYDTVETLLKVDDQLLEKYPALQKNREAVGKLPNIAEYLANRKETAN